jgi:hypothetical protein
MSTRDIGSMKASARDLTGECVLYGIAAAIMAAIAILLLINLGAGSLILTIPPLAAALYFLLPALRQNRTWLSRIRRDLDAGTKEVFCGTVEHREIRDDKLDEQCILVVAGRAFRVDEDTLSQVGEGEFVEVQVAPVSEVVLDVASLATR